MAGFLYIGVTMSAIILYGGNLNKNFIVNIAGESKNPNTMTLLVTIIITFATHVPFIFFAGKQSFLTILDEIFIGGTSSALAQEYYSPFEKEIALDS